MFEYAVMEGMELTIYCKAILLVYYIVCGFSVAAESGNTATGFCSRFTRVSD